jgi:hypothetical protein
VLIRLQHSLTTVISALLNILGILKPVAGALLDKDFQNGIDHATYQLGRIEAWVKHQAANKAPQALLVPAVKEVGAWEAQLGDTAQAAGEKVVDSVAGLVQTIAAGAAKVKYTVKDTVAKATETGDHIGRSKILE